MQSISGVIHETGHALYEQGLPAAHFGTPLAEAVSLGIHESQSRLWENLVGKSRAFWTYFYPLLQKEFPAPLRNVPLDSFYRAINAVQPSFIRVEADEVTYNLHIILRFEIEKALIEGNIAVEDLPRIWNSKMKELLGARCAGRFPGRVAGRSLVGRNDRLLPHLFAGKSLLGAVFRRRQARYSHAG